MNEAAVVDASPLIHLARTDRLHLLRTVAPTLIVPQPVLEEVRAKGAKDKVAQSIQAVPWLRPVPSPSIPPEVTVWDLGAGEASVLAWALSHRDTTTILDDQEGRRCARMLGLPVIGTLGIVLRAKRQGLIPAARPVVEDLVSHGMYLSKEIVREALALVGE